MCALMRIKASAMNICTAMRVQRRVYTFMFVCEVTLADPAVRWDGARWCLAVGCLRGDRAHDVVYEVYWSDMHRSPSPHPHISVCLCLSHCSQFMSCLCIQTATLSSTPHTHTHTRIRAPITTWALNFSLLSFWLSVISPNISGKGLWLNQRCISLIATSELQLLMSSEKCGRCEMVW